MARDDRQHAPATARNRDAILNVLQDCLPKQGRVLEIASGTGEHAAYFAKYFPQVKWQPSDYDAARLKSIEAWTMESGLKNIDAPIQLDVTKEHWPFKGNDGEANLDAIFCANMIHIAPISALYGLLKGAQKYLKSGAPLILYGPYKTQYGHTAPSNVEFDAYLKGENPEWGIRSLDMVVDEARQHGLIHQKTIEMPANNLSLVFKKQGN